MSNVPVSSRRTKIPPIVGIFLTAFLDILSFGMFLPDIQLRGKHLGASEWQLAALLAVYSLAQLLTAPLLGVISDRYGRRRVLLLTTLLATAAYVVYAHGAVLWVVFVARALLGIAGASMGVAFAYIADVTKPHERAKGLGMLGAAFGLGFILGPVTGSLLLKAGSDSPLVLGYVGATLQFINFLYVWLLLPDSKPIKKTDTPGTVIHNFGIAMRSPALGLLLLMFFAINFAFTNLETTFFLLLRDPRSIQYVATVDGAKIRGAAVLGIVGIIGAIVQGGLIRSVMPRFGEVKLIRFSYIVLPLTLALVPFGRLWFPGVFVVMFMGLASGLAQPSLQSLISRNAPSEIQGGVFGITQSLGAVARLIGPAVSIPLFTKAPYLPYLLGAGIYLFPAAGAWALKQPKVEPLAVADPEPVHA